MRHKESVIEQYRREISVKDYQEIRELWKVHSKAEDAHDIEGLISTLTEDCVYEIPQTEHKWVGHEGATRFYTELLTAFPDVNFELQNIVIGPQGVFEEVHVTGTHKAQWLDNPATGEHIEFNVLIFFPWDPERKLFTGERIFSDLY